MSAADGGPDVPPATGRLADRLVEAHGVEAAEETLARRMVSDRDVLAMQALSYLRFRHGRDHDV